MPKEETDFTASFASILSERLSGSRFAGLIALSVTLLLHIFCILFLPPTCFTIPALPQPEDNLELEIEITPAEAPDRESLRFVEANPEAPENRPDRSDQYSFRSTQAADFNQEDSRFDVPRVEGQEQSQKIIEGAVNLPVLLPPSVPEQVAAAKNDEGVDGSPDAVLSIPVLPEVLPAEFIRNSEMIKDKDGSSPERNDSQKRTREESPDQPISLYQRRTTDQDSTLSERPNDGMAEGSNPSPRIRPRLAPELLSGPIMQSQGSASRRGILSIDATFTQFGEYEQQFYAALQLGWYQEIEFHQPMDAASTVVLRFTMKSDGSIHDIEVLQTNAGEVATFICRSALAKRSPFRPWAKEMIEVFGPERKLTVRFNYR